MDDCSQIDDTALIAIGSSCPNLLGITIASSSPNFSDRGVITVARGCPALESISISYCPNITDVGVIVLAQNCFQLKCITLTSSKITDASLIAFATNSRKLQSVTFNNCDCITSTGLSILSVECTQMQKMSFETSKKVQKENLLSLRRKYLSGISLQNGASEHIRHTSALSTLRYYLSFKWSMTLKIKYGYLKWTLNILQTLLNLNDITRIRCLTISNDSSSVESIGLQYYP